MEDKIIKKLDNDKKTKKQSNDGAKVKSKTKLTFFTLNNYYLQTFFSFLYI